MLQDLAEQVEEGNRVERKDPDGWVQCPLVVSPAALNLAAGRLVADRLVVDLLVVADSPPPSVGDYPDRAAAKGKLAVE